MNQPKPLTDKPPPSAAIQDQALQNAARLILSQAGEDLSRAGLVRTPLRFAEAMEDMTNGYKTSIAGVVGHGLFPAEGAGLVSVQNSEFFSLCEHHLLPFWGHVSVAYLPNQKILGLSKIPRIIEVFARRFQVQERMTREILEAMVEILSPKAVVVRARAAHLCMMMRGVEKQNAMTLTENSFGLDTLQSDEKNRIWLAADIKN